MATRTWKLGEICRGGIITAEVKGTKIAIIGKDWDMTAGCTKGSSQKNAKEWTRLEVDMNSRNAYGDMNDFLHDLTSSYYADKIIKWIESKLPLDKTSKDMLNTMHRIDSEYGINW